jgi:hypothetical protein
MTVRRYWMGLSVMLLIMTGAVRAQSTVAVLDLPDAPQAQSAGTGATAQGATAQPAQGGSTGTTTAMADTAGSKAPHRRGRGIASKYTFYIPDNEKSVPLTNGDKWRLVGVESVGGFTFATAILAAGFEQVINGNPKYGTDRGAFGERLGAAYIRQTSQAVFTEGIGDTLLHDDPRYYAMGRNHGFGRRVFYAATRVISTRSDTGEQRFNAPEILGYLGASALTQAYYPASSRGADVVFTGWGLSLGAAALGFEFHEFFPDVLRVVHLKKD